MDNLNKDDASSSLLGDTSTSKFMEDQLISDEQARVNVEENRKWMLGGFIHRHHTEQIQEAFKFVHNDIELSKGANGEVEDLVTGPAVRWALLGNFMTWTTFIVVTVFSTYFVDVDDKGIAMKPKGVYLVGGIFLWGVLTGLVLITEYKALMYVLPAQSVCMPRIAEGKGAWMPFNRWMCSMLGISVILHADIYTTAIFMGRIWASVSACDELNQLWALAVSSSFLGKVPILRSLTYSQLCAMAWCLMVSQLLYALAYSLAISPNVNKGMDIDERRVNYKMVSTKDKVQKYDTVSKLDTGHGRCVQALSESGRMCSLNWQDDNYLEQAERDWDAVRVHSEMRRTNVRFMLFCMQATIIPNLQITFLGIQKSRNAQSGSHSSSTDYLTILSFTISVLSGLHYIYYEFGSVSRHSKYAVHAIQKAKDQAEKSKNGRKHWDAILLEQKVKVSIFANYMFTCLFSAMFAFVLVKAVMEIILCDSGIWNAHFDFHTLSPMGGCVPVEALHWENVTCLVRDVA